MGEETRNGQDEENPEFKNFQRLLKQVVSVSKEKIVDEKKAEQEREKKGRKQPK